MKKTVKFMISIYDCADIVRVAHNFNTRKGSLLKFSFCYDSAVQKNVFYLVITLSM